MNPDSLLSSFDFDFYHYGVAFEEVDASWFFRFISGESTRKRYWIFRKSKHSYKEKEEIKVFCTHQDVWDELHYLFYKTTEVGDRRKILYFSSLSEPVALLESVKAKLDGDSLNDHTLFNTKDLGW